MKPFIPLGSARGRSRRKRIRPGTGATKVMVSVSSGPSSLVCARITFLRPAGRSRRRRLRCGIEEFRRILLGDPCLSSNDEIVAHRELRHGADVLQRDLTFCPGLTSNAVTSNRILSSASTVISFGGAEGAFEQLVNENRKAPQASAKSGRVWLNICFMSEVSSFPRNAALMWIKGMFGFCWKPSWVMD